MDEFMRDARDRMYAAMEKDVEDHLRLEFRIQQRISVHAPWWMPQWLYRRLMRSILIEQGPLWIGRNR